jgi:hypothetical protein
MNGFFEMERSLSSILTIFPLRKRIRIHYVRIRIHYFERFLDPNTDTNPDPDFGMVADPHLINADLDPAFFLIADPDPGIFSEFNSTFLGNFLK